MRTKRACEQVTALPVLRKENETDYRKAMDRMARLGHGRETPMDIIAYMEREIDKYRAEINRLRNRDATLQFQMPTEGMIGQGILCDRVFFMEKNDVLLLHSHAIVREEDLTRKQDEITSRTGIRTVIFDRSVDVVGVVRHGT